VACLFRLVDSNGFTPCTNQAEIDKYINEIVPLLEADSRVISYYYSDGYGLGSVWPTVFNGKLSYAQLAFPSITPSDASSDR
jgi:hypothetical protein